MLDYLIQLSAPVGETTSRNHTANKFQYSDNCANLGMRSTKRVTSKNQKAF